MWAGVVALLASLPGTATALSPDTLWDARVEVPFLAQGPLLCGGAAAAMVERYWGARGVYGEDFQHLVRPAEGGIRASELVAAVRGRGYSTEVVTGRPESAFAALAEGIPPVLLLESGATTLHYVVLVAFDGEDAWIHDPNFGPDRRMTVEELRDRWTASGFWSLLAVPSGGASHTGARSEPPRSEDSSPREGGGPPAAATEAMDLLRNDDPAAARSVARTLLGHDGVEASLGRRLLATSWYLEGESERALDEWNVLGEPTIDLVRIDGTAATRFTVAARRMSLENGELLTSSALGTARRRLAQLPSLEASRVDYQPLTDGTVEVRAVVAERPVVPSPLTLVMQGVITFAHGRAAVTMGPFVTGGERWRVTGSRADEQRFFGWSMSTPAPPLPGVVEIGMEVRRERFGLAGPGGEGADQATRTEERVRTFLGLEEWLEPNFRMGVVLGVESWDAEGSNHRVLHAALSGHWATELDDAWVTLTGAGWTGAGPAFARLGLEAGVDMPKGGQRAWRFRAGATTASREAPFTLWPGAGTGGVREPLLRGHALTDDRVIRGPSFGRRLLHGTVEHRVFRSLGAVRLGAALFVDGAYVEDRADGGRDVALVDVGGGLLLGAWSREMGLHLAHGAAGWLLSVRVAEGP